MQICRDRKKIGGCLGLREGFEGRGLGRNVDWLLKGMGWQKRSKLMVVLDAHLYKSLNCTLNFLIYFLLGHSMS